MGVPPYLRLSLRFIMNPPDIKALLHIVKTGNRQEVKIAQKAIESAWHNYYIPHRVEGRKAFNVFLEEIKTFEDIPNVDHKAYFISSLKWAFWTIGEEYFEVWAEFILRYIEHPSGKIRQALIHITDILIISLTDFPSRSHTKKEEEKVIKELREVRNLNRFGNLVLGVEELLHKYHLPKYNRYKYVSSLPPGVYKSLQILLTQQLLQSESYKNRYNEFLANLQKSRFKSNQVN